MPTPDAKVGFRDIYRAVGETETRIMARLDSIALGFSGTLSDHESRIRVLEVGAVASLASKAAAVDARTVSRNGILLGVAVLGAVFGSIGTLIGVINLITRVSGQ